VSWPGNTIAEHSCKWWWVSHVSTVPKTNQTPAAHRGDPAHSDMMFRAAPPKQWGRLRAAQGGRTPPSPRLYACVCAEAKRAPETGEKVHLTWYLKQPWHHDSIVRCFFSASMLIGTRSQPVDVS
jgi:hypothetical protein